MSLQQILCGSFISTERLMQAREFYGPRRHALPIEAEYARWTQRLAVQGELGAARELASLTDEQLAALEAEFMRCPTRLRTDRMRFAMPVGIALMALGCIGLAFDRWAGHGVATGYSASQALSIVMIGLGLLALAAGALAAFSMLHLDLSHGTTGLYAGRLDEQHPWIYKTASLLPIAPAEEYRQAVLRERGPLRGLDYIIMRELVEAHRVLESTRSTRSVAEQIQHVAVPGPTEPRLVRVTVAAARQA